MTLLEVKNLRTQLLTPRGYLQVLNGVSFQVKEGRILALVGESGCGKTMTALSILKILPPFSKVFGEVLYEGCNLLELPEETLQKMRGKEISMIFQEPSRALNPVLSIGEQLIETLIIHHGFKKNEACEKALALLANVGFSNPILVYRSYPHQLSGGMKQRVMIALALAGEPKLLIADEPTTALDVSIQAQIIDLLYQLVKERNLTMILITHNLALVSYIADFVSVMYMGTIVESGPTEVVLSNPLHPYTKGLLESLPVEPSKPLRPIPGSLPSPFEKIVGCYFHPRCGVAEDICKTKVPPKIKLDDREIRCWLHADSDRG